MKRLDSDDGIIRQLGMQNLVVMARHGGSTERIISMIIARLDDPDKLFRALAVQVCRPFASPPSPLHCTCILAVCVALVIVRAFSSSLHQ